MTAHEQFDLFSDSDQQPPAPQPPVDEPYVRRPLSSSLGDPYVTQNDRVRREVQRAMDVHDAADEERASAEERQTGLEAARAARKLLERSGEGGTAAYEALPETDRLEQWDQT